MAINSKNSSKRQEATAYHEAGHAVIAIAVKRPFHYVTIVPTEDALGHVQHHAWGEGFNPEYEMNSRIEGRLEKAILTLLAGRVAERRFTGRWNNMGARDDVHSAINLASYVTRSDKVLQAYFTYMETQAENMVNAPFNWAAIQALAAELLIQPRISYRKARQIINNEQRQVLERIIENHRGRRAGGTNDAH